MQTTNSSVAFRADDVLNSFATAKAWPIAPQTYYQKFETSLKHSNATQNVYFSNFFEWQGAVRERWFFECIANDMLQDQGVFITKRAHNEYLKEAFPFQTVTCSLNAFNIQKCSFYLLFSFYINDELASRGYQQIVFADKEKRIARLPDQIIRKIKKFERTDIDLDDLK